ncbi:YcxB family protein [Spartinivicinus ruber]|uniref:YcxB family protein n=1 Tax=Spartinivicinus ruber TaxID=2683272 RepID=UPI0013D07936|nr:YcxB family protein [Spartinivicinus ruber]
MFQNNMNTEYSITEDDYVRAMKLFSKITTKAAVIYLIIIGVAVIAAIFGSPVIKGSAIGGLVGGGSVAIVMRFLINPILSRRDYRKYKAIQEPIKIHLLNEGVQFSASDGEGIVRWEQVHKWRQNDDYLLIYPMPGLYHIIPKSIAESGFDLSGLITTLHEKVGNEA